MENYHKDGPKLENYNPDDKNQSSPNLLLDLSLSGKDLKDLDPHSHREANLIGCFEANSSPRDNSNGPPLRDNETEPRVFSCNYCQRKFYSSQALGGHQNAHKRERSLAKRGQRLVHASAASAGFGSYPYLNRFPSMASLPLHGSHQHRSTLNIDVHSLAHNNAGFKSLSKGCAQIYGHDGWSTRQAIHHQPAVGRLAEDYYDINGGVGMVGSSGSPPPPPPPPGFGAARLDVMKKFSSSRDGGFWWSNVGHFKSKQDEIQKLDLSLKL